MLNEDYRDILQVFADENVRFLLVGAYALAAHGYPRATMAIDLWIMPSSDNAEAVLRALRRFGAPLEHITAHDLQVDGNVFQIGVAPRRVDIMTAASGLRFEDVFARSVSIEIDGITVHVPCLSDLIRNKRASGRAKDLADAEALEDIRDAEGPSPAALPSATSHPVNHTSHLAKLRELIRELKLEPHPEGGWYREIYRSPTIVRTPRGERSAITTIHYLLAAGQFSRWHVVESDEIWHFYRGEPLELLTYIPWSQGLVRHELRESGQVVVVSAGVWQAARPLGSYSLVGCTVGPGFAFEDFRLVSALTEHVEHLASALGKHRDLL